MSDNNGKSLSALIVDDEEEIRDGLEAFLKEMNCWQFIIHAANGYEAYMKVQMQNFDLVVADLKMPKWDGMEFIKHCRQKEKEQRTPILFISGHFTKEDIKNAMNLQVKHFLSKPFNGDIFLNKVAEILRQERQLAGKKTP